MTSEHLGAAGFTGRRRVQGPSIPSRQGFPILCLRFRGTTARHRPVKAALRRSVPFAALALLPACSPGATTAIPGGGDGQSPLLVLVLFVVAGLVVAAAAMAFRRRKGPKDRP